MDINNEDLDTITVEFKQLLEAELDRRHIPYHSVDTDNMKVNLDVNIQPHSSWRINRHFSYIPWGWLLKKQLGEMTLQEYVAKYANDYYINQRDHCKWRLKESNLAINGDNTTASFLSQTMEEQAACQEWLEASKDVID